MPDSLSIKSGWIGEDQGIINWSGIHFHDIAKYFEEKSPNDFINRLHSGYKQEQAYCYIACESVQDGFHHKVTAFLNFVLCLFTKDKVEMTSGQIISVYCKEKMN